MKLENTSLEGGVECIALEGRLDIDGTQAIEMRFSFMTTTSKSKFVIDLSRVSFIASIGIRLLMSSARGQKARGGLFVLAAPEAAVKKVLVTAGIDQLIPLYDDVESARVALADQ
jgi:anti-anti-sigma factor